MSLAFIPRFSEVDLKKCKSEAPYYVRYGKVSFTAQAPQPSPTVCWGCEPSCRTFERAWGMLFLFVTAAKVLIGDT